MCRQDSLHFGLSLMVQKTFAFFALAFAVLGSMALAIEPLVVVVMDPLSGPLACDCVEGYAQRKYEKLGEYLEKSLGRPVKVAWNDSLAESLKDDTAGKADVIIGKYSVVQAQTKKLKITVAPIARLTGRDGATDQWGLLVVRSGDAAQSVSDLNGYRVFAGPAEAEEKSGAAAKCFKEAGVAVNSTPEIFDACSEAAKGLMKLPTDAKAVAVISSYAEPLLEGCKAVKKGDLRVIGRTESIPFVTAFANAKLSAEDKAKVTTALLETGTKAELLIALETLEGFVSLDEATKKDADAAQSRQKETATAKKN